MESASESMTLLEIIETGGWPIMSVLGAMSIVGLSFVFYFFIVLRREVIMPRNFLKDLYKKISTGRMSEAKVSCGKSSSAAAAIAGTALSYVERIDEDDVDIPLLKELMEGEGDRQATLIQNQTQYLLDIAVISPMVGLLGTVMGMLRAFNAVALDVARAKPMDLAHGVSQALITTAAGLIIGIPAMIFYAYFRGRTAKLLSNLEVVSSDVLTLLSHKKSLQENNSEHPLEGAN